jgi:hypothetical protein
MTVWIVLENCCGHFSGVFATEQEAKVCVKEYGDDEYSYHSVLI